MMGKFYLDFRTSKFTMVRHIINCRRVRVNE